MVPKHSANVPKHKKTVMCLKEKIHVLDKFVWAWLVLLVMSSMLVNQQYIK